MWIMTGTSLKSRSCRRAEGLGGALGDGSAYGVVDKVYALPFDDAFNVFRQIPFVVIQSMVSAMTQADVEPPESQGLGEFRGRAVGRVVAGWGAQQSRHGLRDHWGVEAQRS